jgi:hypothetical protein
MVDDHIDSSTFRERHGIWLGLCFEHIRSRVPSEHPYHRVSIHFFQAAIKH